ncbi:hypothetical protein LINPERPRIM_LOCUS6245 [Linum perenne]
MWRRKRIRDTTFWKDDNASMDGGPEPEDMGMPQKCSSLTCNSEVVHIVLPWLDSALCDVCSFFVCRMGDGMIDVVIRHGGRMDFSGSEPKYVGGEENIVGFDTDYLSYRTIMAVARDDLDYQIVHRIWWLPPKKTMANGLRELFGDNEILYGLMIDVNKVEDDQFVMFFEATEEVSGGWDNEDGNLGDDEGMNSDDDDGAENSAPTSPLCCYIG